MCWYLAGAVAGLVVGERCEDNGLRKLDNLTTTASQELDNLTTTASQDTDSAHPRLCSTMVDEYMDENGNGDPLPGPLKRNTRPL
ncbi:unnamed protein product [Gadus morhua 'NCC']